MSPVHLFVTLHHHTGEHRTSALWRDTYNFKNIYVYQFSKKIHIVDEIIPFVSAVDLDLCSSNVQDAFVIAVEQQARERLERLSALKRITPVDMTKLSQQVSIFQTSPLIIPTQHTYFLCMPNESSIRIFSTSIRRP